jgi:electron transport complex protein RnfE
MNQLQNFTKGLLKENPILVLVLGTCPTLATTSSALNGMGMGIATTFVLIGSNVVISLLAKLIPDKVRIPAFIVVIASFVTIVDLVMQAYVPDLYKTLGIFIPLIVVNCIVLGRAEAFASKNTVLSSFVDGVGMGLGLVSWVLSAKLWEAEQYSGTSSFRETGSLYLYLHREHSWPWGT